jgi:hypothetical protein
MTYDEFLDIPVSVLKDLETILLLKLQYQMDLTSEEREIRENMKRFYDERVKSVELVQQKLQLEKLLEL